MNDAPHDTRASARPRDRYEVVGPAMRAALTKANRECSRFELRVLNAVIAQVSSYSRLADRVAASQLAAIVYDVDTADVTGRQRDRVVEGLRALKRRGVIEYVPGVGRRAMPTVGLPKTHPDTRAGFDGNTPRFETETHPDSDTKPAPLDGHSEKTSEKRERDASICLLEGLIANGNHRSRSELEEECRAAIARATTGRADMVVRDAVDSVISRGAIWPSALDEYVKAHPSTTDSDWYDTLHRPYCASCDYSHVGTCEEGRAERDRIQAMTA